MKIVHVLKDYFLKVFSMCFPREKDDLTHVTWKIKSWPELYSLKPRCNLRC